MILLSVYFLVDFCLDYAYKFRNKSVWFKHYVNE